MDIFDIHDMKVEKANAMLQYRRLRKIAELFRIIELFLALILFSWITTRLPFVVGILSDYLRQLLSVIVSPLFVFLICNMIVLTLVVKSGQITDNPSDVNITGSYLYEEIANNVREDVLPPVIEPEEIVYQDKRIISEINTNSNTKPISEKIKANSVPDLDLKVYRRSKSENLMKNEADKVDSKLKRSETEIGRRVVETPVTEKVVVDELSNEEFKRRIEGFIARQKIRFHHQERLAIVAHKS